jgi:signal transduction histidine kinase
VRERDPSRDALVQAGLILASELSLPAVLQKIANLACDVADARYGALGVLGPDGQIHEFVTHGVTEDERRAIGHIPVGKGILGALISDARPLRLRRIQDDPRSVGFPSNHPPMTTFLGVPITIHGRVYGNLYLTEKRGAPEFTPGDEAAVITLATQAAVAVENARLYDEARSHRRRLEGIGEVMEAILAGRDLDDVLKLVARHAKDLAAADLATIAMPLGSELLVRVAEGANDDQLLGKRFSMEHSISGQVMEMREPLVLVDASIDERVQQPIVTAANIGPALFVPLVSGEGSMGTLMVGNLRGGRQFAEDDVGPLVLFAAQAGVAIDNARIREELQRLAVLEDRERIAKELHDGIIQSLFAVGMGLQAVGSRADDPAAVRPRLETAVEDIDRVIRDLRNYIFGLGPGGPADRQLDQALRDLVEEFRRGSDIAMRVSIDPEAASLLAPHASDVLQLAREAVANAVRHSGARTVAIELQQDVDGIVLEVEDDGSGFDPEAATRGHGLANLRSRAEAIGGRLEIVSAPGRGTSVRLSMPD